MSILLAGDFPLTKNKKLQYCDTTKWANDFFALLKLSEGTENKIIIEDVVPIRQYCNDTFETFRVIYTVEVKR